MNAVEELREIAGQIADIGSPYPYYKMSRQTYRGGLSKTRARAFMSTLDVAVIGRDIESWLIAELLCAADELEAV